MNSDLKFIILLLNYNLKIPNFNIIEQISYGLYYLIILNCINYKYRICYVISNKM